MQGFEIAKFAHIRKDYLENIFVQDYIHDTLQSEAIRNSLCVITICGNFGSIRNIDDISRAVKITSTLVISNAL